MSGVVLKLLNGIYGVIVGTIILTAALFAGYSIWDNSQIYRAAENVQDQIRQLKPEYDKENGADFDKLRDVNGDVIAWLTVDGTNIDYPVLQGKDNLEYMNKDVYGEFSLAGSIFLDSRNNADFSDNYSLIYGHNMDEHFMFGDLALFKDKEFFAENTSAEILLPGENREYSIAAILQIPAGTEEIFNPLLWNGSLSGFGAYLKDNSIWYHSLIIDAMIADPDLFEAVSLATCSDGSTNDRTVLILIRNKNKDNPHTSTTTTTITTTTTTTTTTASATDTITTGSGSDTVTTTVTSTTTAETTTAITTPTTSSVTTKPTIHYTTSHTTSVSGDVNANTSDTTTGSSSSYTSDVNTTTTAADTDDVSGSGTAVTTKPVTQYTTGSSDKSDGVGNITSPPSYTRPNSGGNVKPPAYTRPDGGGNITPPSYTTTKSDHSVTDNADSDIGGAGPKPTGDAHSEKFWYCLIAGIALFIAVFEITERLVKKHTR